LHVASIILPPNHHSVHFCLGSEVQVGLLLLVDLELLTINWGCETHVAQVRSQSVVVGLCLLVGGVILRYAILAAGASLAGNL
jgi:hypothetical protein